MLFGVGILVMFSKVWMFLCIMASTPPHWGSLVVYCRILPRFVLFVLFHKIL